jgi:hypothetical protein
MEDMCPYFSKYRPRGNMNQNDKKDKTICSTFKPFSTEAENRWSTSSIDGREYFVSDDIAFAQSLELRA